MEATKEAHGHRFVCLVKREETIEYVIVASLDLQLAIAIYAARICSFGKIIRVCLFYTSASGTILLTSSYMHATLLAAL